MKRVILITLTVMLVSAIIFGGCAKPAEEAPTTPTTPAAPTTPTAPEVKPIEWRYATFIPADESQVVKTMAWAKRLEEATGGRMRITFYCAESLVKIGGTLRACEAGTCDIACPATSVLPERLPLSMVTNLPMMFSHGTPQAAQTWMALYNKYEELRNEYLPTKVLWAQNPGATNLVSANKPIQTLEDLKGLKLRTTTKYEVKGYALFGAVPVPVSGLERYHALERGITDANSDDWQAVWTWKLHEVSKYRTDGINWTHHVIPTIINVESYNKLPEDIKRIFDELTPAMELSREVGKYHWEVQSANTEKIKEFDKKVGNPPFYVLPEAERQRWIEVILPLREEWASEMEAKGLPGRAMLADAIAFAEQYK